jgi:hypothetical protein
MRNQPEVDQARLFESGNNLNSPSRGGAHPFEKSLGISSVAQSGCRHNSHKISPKTLRGAMKSSQDLDRLAHRFRREEVGTKDTFSQSSDLAVFVDRLKLSTAEAGDLEANRVGTDVDGGEDGHSSRAVDYEVTRALAHSLISQIKLVVQSKKNLILSCCYVCHRT